MSPPSVTMSVTADDFSEISSNILKNEAFLIITNTHNN